MTRTIGHALESPQQCCPRCGAPAQDDEPMVARVYQLGAW